jgi:hypothetical protein
MFNYLPEHVVTIPTYEQFRSYARAFAAGHLSVLIVCGPPGQAKSWTIRHAVGREAR